MTLKAIMAGLQHLLLLSYRTGVVLAFVNKCAIKYISGILDGGLKASE